MKRKVLVFLLGSLLLGTGPAVANDEEIKAAVGLGKLMGAELMRKRASVCASEAGMVIVGYQLKAHPEHLSQVLESSESPLEEKSKLLVKKGFNMEQLDPKLIIHMMGQCLDEQLRIVQLNKS